MLRMRALNASLACAYLGSACISWVQFPAPCGHVTVQCSSVFLPWNPNLQTIVSTFTLCMQASTYLAGLGETLGAWEEADAVEGAGLDDLVAGLGSTEAETVGEVDGVLGEGKGDGLGDGRGEGLDDGVAALEAAVTVAVTLGEGDLQACRVAREHSRRERLD